MTRVIPDSRSLIEPGGLGEDTGSMITGTFLNDGNEDNYLNDIRSQNQDDGSTRDAFDGIMNNNQG